MIFLMASLIASAQAAKVYGTVYEWSDLEKPLKNVIVEVEANSSMAQYNVSTTGTYLFALSPGNYSIKAKYFSNNILEYTGEEKIRINRVDDLINIDILLFPPLDSEREYIGDINLTGEIDVKNENLYSYVIPVFIILFLVLFAFYWSRKKKTSRKEPITHENPVHPAEISDIGKEELPSDLKELYDIILKTGGRITQKELRKKLPYSEAKVSLMLDDLEERGLIKKIKKGRANIILAGKSN
ncbi:Uncharacterised protein [uncultured archaeon]|nr:Uncharacterised protein [uncultured archaeon]